MILTAPAGDINSGMTIFCRNYRIDNIWSRGGWRRDGEKQLKYR
ncbi:hypothetical protein KKY_331 [Pelagibacterium halotolerans B2]|uniref:Uncharacterized protein n=1 Tax=Pelagibacterium halotolerans (strain DSM 22347 / JCM 15775 / CGMCC 1.7692 / B2) TaxID=1082931 RepID=G4R8U0_PELHB|nr:hypothetical protein KKY_331 [Pelagibacterium halotolerans B2]